MPNTVESGKWKYERKTYWVKLNAQIRGIQDDVHINQAVAQAQVALTQQKVQALLDEIGVYADIRHQYHSYALALEKSQRELRFMVDLIREHQILRNRFERRGLDPAVLHEIDALIIFRTGDA